MIDDVIARLEASVPDLAYRVEGAANFAALMKSNALPQHGTAAHVLPLGLRGGNADASTGAFTQMVEEVVGIVLTVRTFSQTGDKALIELKPLIDAVVNAIAGWGPEDAMGVFRLVRGSLVTMAAGTMVYQIDFSISDQLRILS
tara:strand:- start:2824 stop:3255 length:432 start_codon:yes stop_codon:yes gene_type:complete